ncbi:hypothetical protein P5705_16925, partial [Pseudomonas entomophila]
GGGAYDITFRTLPSKLKAGYSYDVLGGTYTNNRRRSSEMVSEHSYSGLNIDWLQDIQPEPFLPQCLIPSSASSISALASALR